MDIREYDDRFVAITPEQDVKLLRQTFEIADSARAAGNHPFGALLADAEGNILMEQQNIQETKLDVTGHAETTLVRRAAREYDKEFLWNCSLYTSAEPCCMCAGAIYWGNIGRIVFAMTEKDLLTLTGDNVLNPTFDLSCREVLSKGQKPIVVKGPYPELVEEAVGVHKGFWD